MGLQNKIMRFLLFGFLCCLGGVLYGQDVEKLPDDPRVKQGTTANGLHYIIIQNNAQKGKAHFCIAQKVGTSLENSSSRGSFMLLEQLATKGTRNFEGSAITDYLKSLGVNQEQLSFETLPDKLIYSIKDVPTKRANTIDSSLLILYNWMCAINIDEEDLATERGVLSNRILVEAGKADYRLQSEQIKALYPDSPYIDALNPDNLSNLKNLNSRDLRGFYYTWCRPDLQCIIVVGDIDGAKVETQIKSIFATIPKSLKSEKRKYYQVPEFDGIKSIVLKDREYNKTTVELTLLKAPLKEAYRQSNLPYIQDYMDDALFFLLQNRLRDGIVEQGLPIYDIEISKGNYLNMASTNAYSVRFQTLPSSIYSSISFIGNELKSIVNNGFSKQEFTSTIDLYWKRLENGYDNRSTFSNDIYLQRALDSYFEGYGLASTEMNFEIMKDVLYSLEQKNLNDYAKALLSQRNNIIICCKMPDAPGIEQLSDSQLEQALMGSSSETRNVDWQKEATWPVVEFDKTATIVSSEEDSVSGEKILKLSNGATVVLKQTGSFSDTITFKAVSRGGFSLMKGVNSGNQAFFNDVLNISKIGGIGFSDMQRLYAYNHLNIESHISPNSEEIEGWATAKNLDKLLDGIYLNFSQRGEDQSAYDIYKQRIIYYTKFKSISPDGIFADSVNYYNYSNKKFVESITTEEIESYNYPTLHSQLSERFANGADFIFIFVGDNIEDYTEQIVQHIGNIPSDPAKKEREILLPNYRTKGNVSKRFFAKMRVPSSYAHITYSAHYTPDINSFLLSEMTKYYLEEFIKESLGKTITNTTVDGEIELYPEKMFVLKTYFEGDSLSVSKALLSIDTELNNIANGKIAPKKFNRVVGDLIKLFKGEKENRQEWIDYLATKYNYNHDYFFEVADIQNLTTEDFAAFVKNILNNGNKICVILDGTTADIETLRLLKENEFIRQYFDLR